jgi:hypothetical protein
MLVQFAKRLSRVIRLVYHWIKILPQASQHPRHILDVSAQRPLAFVMTEREREMPRIIDRPGDLPRAWQQKWRACAEMYANSRMYSREKAEHEAFLLVRDSYWRQARKARDGDDGPGYDLKGGEDAIAGDA